MPFIKQWSVAFLLILSVPSLGKTKIIKLGISSNFSKVSSSSSNPYGNYFRNGIQLALLEAQDRLRKAGIAIELVEFDHEDSQPKVLEVAKQACASDVVAVLGYVYSSHALLAAPIHQQCKLPMLSSSASANRLGGLGAYVHQGTFNNAFQGKVLAEYATQALKAKTAASIAIANCAYCQDLSRSFAQVFKKQGGKIEEELSVLREGDYTKLANRFKQDPVDVILVPNHEIESANIILALRKSGVKSVFLGGDGWGDTGKIFFKTLADHKINGYSVSHWRKDLKNKRSKKFYQAYTQKFSQEPNDTAVLSFDSMNLLIEQFLQLEVQSRVNVEKMLGAVKIFNGVTGKFFFRSGHSPEKSIVLLRADKGGFELLKHIHPQVKR